MHLLALVSLPPLIVTIGNFFAFALLPFATPSHRQFADYLAEPHHINALCMIFH